MKTLKVIGTNEIFKHLEGKEFHIENISTNDIKCHLIKIYGDWPEIYFDSSSTIKFFENAVLLQGYAQIGNNLGNLAVLIS